jgi:AMP phosphorylase
MRLKVKILGMNAGQKHIAVLHEDDAEELGIRSLGRVMLKYNDKTSVAIVNTTKKVVGRREIGLFDEITEHLDVKDGNTIDVTVSGFPKSISHIKSKLRGRKLSHEEILEIVKDAVEGRLSEVELTSFVSSLNNFGLDLEESVSMAKAMVETGKRFKFNNSYIVDKHSIGGVPGDKTTLLLVPIIAACGLTIPKTSSRAITSAAGTADRAEVLMPVGLDTEEMRTVVKNTNGCIVWGGSLDLAPADDIFIQIEYPMSIDPLMIPSIMSKKNAVGAEYLVVDIPCGRGTKIKTIGDANLLAKDFIEVGNRLGIKTECAITYGEQPIGYTIGPALEAREALEIITRKRNVPDVIDKTKHIAKMILEMVGKDNGEKIINEVIKTGKAEEKLRDIIFNQGGDREIQPEDIEIGKYGIDIHAEQKGYVLWIDNHMLVSVARAAGSPKDKGAGILLYKKIGDPVEKDEKLFTIYAEKTRKLKRAQEVLADNRAVGVGERMEMLIHEVKEHPVHKKSFILER